MIGGLSIANVLGVPAGAFLATPGLAVRVLGGRRRLRRRARRRGRAHPAHPAAPARSPQLKRELRIYRDRQVWLPIAITALAAGGVFARFSYLSPLLTDVAGLDEGWVPTVLGLFGVGALIGTAIGGRIADAHLFGVLLSGIAASTVFLARSPSSRTARPSRSPLLPPRRLGLLHRPGPQRPYVQRRGRRPDPRGRDHDGRVQPRQHGRPLARRHGHRRGLRLRLDGLGGRGDDRRGDRPGRGGLAPAPPYAARPPASPRAASRARPRRSRRARGAGRAYAGRPLGLRSPAAVSRRTSSWLPTSTAPAATASAYRSRDVVVVALEGPPRDADAPRTRAVRRTRRR